MDDVENGISIPISHHFSNYPIREKFNIKFTCDLFPPPKVTFANPLQPYLEFKNLRYLIGSIKANSQQASTPVS